MSESDDKYPTTPIPPVQEPIKDDAPPPDDGVPPPKAPTRAWLVPLSIVIALVLTFPVGFLIMPIFFFGVLEGFLVTWIVLSVITVIYLIGCREQAEIKARRTPPDAEARMSKLDAVMKELARDQAYLLDERERFFGNKVRIPEEIFYVTRLHPIALALRLGNIIIIGVLARTAVSLFHLHFPWRIHVIGYIFWAVALFAAYVRWKYWKLLVTNIAVWIVRDPPAWLWMFFQEFSRPFESSTIKGVDLRVSPVTRFFGYGRLNLSTTLDPEEDKYLKNLNYIPDVRGARSTIRRIIA